MEQDKHPRTGRAPIVALHTQSYSWSRPPSVLVAEDDDELRESIALALRGDGYEVILARSGAELLDLVGASMLVASSSPPPDAIISDVRMPGFTGLEILAGLRDLRWRIPIILITGYGDEATVAEARRHGVSAFFTKPFELDDLRTALLNLVPDEAWLRGGRGATGKGPVRGRSGTGRLGPRRRM